MRSHAASPGVSNHSSACVVCDFASLFHSFPISFSSRASASCCCTSQWTASSHLLHRAKKRLIRALVAQTPKPADNSSICKTVPKRVRARCVSMHRAIDFPAKKKVCQNSSYSARTVWLFENGSNGNGQVDNGWGTMHRELQSAAHAFAVWCDLILFSS